MKPSFGLKSSEKISNHQGDPLGTILSPIRVSRTIVIDGGPLHPTSGKKILKRLYHQCYTQGVIPSRFRVSGTIFSFNFTSFFKQICFFEAFDEHPFRTFSFVKFSLLRIYIVFMCCFEKSLLKS